MREFLIGVMERLVTLWFKLMKSKRFHFLKESHSKWSKTKKEGTSKYSKKDMKLPAWMVPKWKEIWPSKNPRRSVSKTKCRKKYKNN